VDEIKKQLWLLDSTLIVDKKNKPWTGESKGKGHIFQNILVDVSMYIVHESLLLWISLRNFLSCQWGQKERHWQGKS
jgi:hypothetical protein